MPCGAVPCCAVRYRSVLCRAVPCCVLSCSSSFVHARYYSKYHTRYRYYSTPLISPKFSCVQISTYTRCVSTMLLSHKKCAPSSAQPSYSSAAQRPAVACLALRCGAVRADCVLFRAYSAMYHAKYQAPGTGMRVCTRHFAFFI